MPPPKLLELSHPKPMPTRRKSRETLPEPLTRPPVQSWGGDPEKPRFFGAGRLGPPRDGKELKAVSDSLQWAQQDLNLRLRPCEGRTLPLSYAPQLTDPIPEPASSHRVRRRAHTYTMRLPV